MTFDTLAITDDELIVVTVISLAGLPALEGSEILASFFLSISLGLGALVACAVLLNFPVYPTALCYCCLPS